MHTKAGIIGLGLLSMAQGAFALPNQDSIHIIRCEPWRAEGAGE